MIHVYGTSHVSNESIELINEKVRQHEPDIIALELDPRRLQALLTDEDQSSGSIFLDLLKKFQQHIGKKTGVMPGEEMKHGYMKAGEIDADVALIDQNIEVTFSRLKQVKRKEKVKAGLSLIFGGLATSKFDFSEIPEDGQIGKILEETKDKFPEIYNVLVAERDSYMAASLQQLQLDNPEAEIVAFVGAGHKESVRSLLEQNRTQRSIMDFNAGKADESSS
ncbi:TraB/GumN family protein [Candidatus Nanohalococcus occultus]|uniref:Pheromone shutdown protein TraB, contains GTxH motif n=1 Tax=Candidatus Nanohalococcus occultus TaxID=2978047 RepID=A0ABY8CDK9_9ARCH|nr:Pheromone shutdown protein TraB, contains GTxH motif [Candidatus Nanohaloarchaeota archaeon SVXNc]